MENEKRQTTEVFWIQPLEPQSDDFLLVNTASPSKDYPFQIDGMHNMCIICVWAHS